MPSVKKFTGDKAKLKKFLTQIKMWIDNKRPKLPTPIKKIAYIGMSLTGKLLKWFQFYLAKAQINRITFTNSKIRYIFLI